MGNTDRVAELAEDRQRLAKVRLGLLCLRQRGEQASKRVEHPGGTALVAGGAIRGQRIFQPLPRPVIIPALPGENPAPAARGLARTGEASGAAAWRRSFQTVSALDLVVHPASS